MMLRVIRLLGPPWRWGNLPVGDVAASEGTPIWTINGAPLPSSCAATFAPPHG